MFKCGNFFILLLNDNRHLLSLCFQINQRLLCLFKFLGDSILNGIISFIDLGKLDLSLDFLLLHLILKLLLSLLGLIESYLLLQCIVLHLLNLQQKILDLAIQLLEYALVLLNHCYLHIIVLLLQKAILLWCAK